MGCCCIKDIRIQDGQLQVLKSGVWETIDGYSQQGGNSGNVPPIDPETETSTQSNACYKATGIWSAIEKATTALINAWDGNYPVFPLMYAAYQADSTAPPTDNADLSAYLSGLLVGGASIADIDAALQTNWENNSQVIKQQWLAWAINGLSSEPRLTDADYLFLRDNRMSNDDLGKTLQAAFLIVEKSYLQEVSYGYIISATCETSAPASASLPPAGFVKLQFVGFARGNTYNAPAPSSTGSPMEILSGGFGSIEGNDYVSQQYTASPQRSRLGLLFQVINSDGSIRAQAEIRTVEFDVFLDYDFVSGSYFDWAYFDHTGTPNAAWAQNFDSPSEHYVLGGRVVGRSKSDTGNNARVLFIRTEAASNDSQIPDYRIFNIRFEVYDSVIDGTTTLTPNQSYYVG